jgi:hypothetical protein
MLIASIFWARGAEKLHEKECVQAAGYFVAIDCSTMGDFWKQNIQEEKTSVLTLVQTIQVSCLYPSLQLYACFM